MKEIGGFFELELQFNKEYHANALRLNTGRNALEYILRAKSYEKIYLPYFTCDVILEPIFKLNLDYEFYNIHRDFTPDFNFERLTSNSVFLYTNYFGINDSNVKMVSTLCKNLIVDNSQSFYSKPLNGIDTFYSPRKFFGVADGSYLYTDKIDNNILNYDLSYQRFEHLLGRIDKSANEFYLKFKSNDEKLKNQPIQRMSKLTQRILTSINYNAIADRRKDNFHFLQENLKQINLISFSDYKDSVPMVYPLMIENGVELKEIMINSKIFVASFWPNVLEWCKSETIESKMVRNTIHIPVDQRYSIDEMAYILRTIFKHV